MAEPEAASSDSASSEPAVDLRNSALAALLAWLIPGAGHAYQRRYGKAALFTICVLVTYFYGLMLGDGHVVYASWKREDFRWQYVCQAGVGLPALPALIQNRRVVADRDPLFGGWLAPPRQPVRPNDNDQLAQWHLETKWRFDLGTLYTMVAGLMNILAVYDAFAGPFVAHQLRAKELQDAEEARAKREREAKSAKRS